MPKWELLCKWLLNNWDFVVVNWQDSHVNTVQNWSSVLCFSIGLLNLPGFCKYTCKTRAKDLIPEKLCFLDRSCFSIWIWSTFSQVTGDSVSANDILVCDDRDIDRVLEQRPWAIDLCDDLSLSTEKSKGSNVPEDGHFKDPADASLKNVGKFSVNYESWRLFLNLEICQYFDPWVAYCPRYPRRLQAHCDALKISQ